MKKVYKRQRLTALNIFLAVTAIMIGSEYASAQLQERHCYIDSRGQRHCEVTPVRPAPPSRPLPPPRPVPPPKPIPPGPPDTYIPPSSYYTLSEFQRFESDALYWERQYQIAPSGSYNERYARDQRNQSIARALDTLRAYGALSGISADEIERFALDLDRKYQIATSGSAIESLYRDARRIVWSELPSIVENEARYARDFREVERWLLEFDHKYQISNSGSLAESTYRNIRQELSSLATRMFESQARYMSQSELYRLQDEYHRRYQLASSGSLLESYYRNIRDIARRLIGYR